MLVGNERPTTSELVVLRAWGVLPANESPPVGDWLPWLAEVWRDNADESTAANAWQELARHGLSLVWIASRYGVPGRLLAWPVGGPSGPLVTAVSSRLGRSPNALAPLLQRLGQRASRWATESHRLLSVAGTATDPLLAAAARQFNLSQFSVEPCRSQRPAAFLRELLAGPTAAQGAFYSPPVVVATPATDRIAFRDRLQLWLTEELEVLQLRGGSKLLPALLDRCHAGLSVRCFFDAMPAQSAEQLRAAGATPLESSIPRRTARIAVPRWPPRDAMKRLQDRLPWPALLHCVRSAEWRPRSLDQTECLQRLLLGLPWQGGTPLATLQSIVAERRLRARCPVGDTRVVCFTAASLSSLSDLRRFQSHRGRWDFLPYAVCVNRDWLQRRGAGPVAYVAADVYHALPPAARRWRQPRCSRSGHNWVAEQEWRTIGDVDLAPLPADQGLILVPTRREQSLLQPQSPWRVMALEELADEGLTSESTAHAEALGSSIRD